MTAYICPEFAATGLELRIIELEASRDEAAAQGWPERLPEIDREIAALWSELAELVERYPAVGA